MQEFFIYLRLGFEHLLDLNAPDHILYILMLALPYSISDWKKLFWLATAFTVGHSITLILAVYTNPHPHFTQWIEFLIAVSIAFTAALNMLHLHSQKFLYPLTIIFGLIHGYGFSGLLKSLLEGLNFNVFTTLFPFNLGLEIAQILWITIILFLNYQLRISKNVKIIVYLITFSISLYWIFIRFPF
jgi:hypothetical protein